MKARIPKGLSEMTEHQIKQVVAEEYEQTKTEHATEFGIRFIAVLLYTKYINTKISTAQLRQEFYDLQSTVMLLEHGIGGVPFTVEDCLDWAKNVLKIDIREEMEEK